MWSAKEGLKSPVSLVESCLGVVKCLLDVARWLLGRAKSRLDARNRCSPQPERPLGVAETMLRSAELTLTLARSVRISALINAGPR
jgi:hypothetical protein